jgi:hypothetical protein
LERRVSTAGRFNYMDHPRSLSPYVFTFID